MSAHEVAQFAEAFDHREREAAQRLQKFVRLHRCSSAGFQIISLRRYIDGLEAPSTGSSFTACIIPAPEPCTSAPLA